MAQQFLPIVSRYQVLARYGGDTLTDKVIINVKCT
jgi:hypothetical protein